MPAKPFEIESINTIQDGIYGVLLHNKQDAMNCLKKNPRAQVMEQDNGDWVLLYSQADIDLKRAVVRR